MATAGVSKESGEDWGEHIVATAGVSKESGEEGSEHIVATAGVSKESGEDWGEHIVAALGFSRIGPKLLYWLPGHYTAVNVSIPLSNKDSGIDIVICTYICTVHIHYLCTGIEKPRKSAILFRSNPE